jgi:hypothetical protein
MRPPAREAELEVDHVAAHGPARMRHTRGRRVAARVSYTLVHSLLPSHPPCARPVQPWQPWQGATLLWPPVTNFLKGAVGKGRYGDSARGGNRRLRECGGGSEWRWCAHRSSAAARPGPPSLSTSATNVSSHTGLPSPRQGAQRRWRGVGRRLRGTKFPARCLASFPCRDGRVGRGGRGRNGRWGSADALPGTRACACTPSTATHRRRRCRCEHVDVRMVARFVLCCCYAACAREGAGAKK